jgi:hypothetical protein
MYLKYMGQQRPVQEQGLTEHSLFPHRMLTANRDKIPDKRQTGL